MLKNKVGIITGASSGIGWATALELNAAGAHLVVNARRADRLESLVEEMGGEAEVVAVDGDVTAPGMSDRLIETARERFGRLDFVFNNAGIMDVGGVDVMTDEVIEDLITINITAATKLAYAACRHFKAHGGGHLVTTSSILGTKVRGAVGVYAGTKYAMEALQESLRMELAGTGVKTTVIEPGLVATELQNRFDPNIANTLGIEKPLQGADIARAVRFVLEQPDHVLIPVMMVLPAEHAI